MGDYFYIIITISKLLYYDASKNLQIKHTQKKHLTLLASVHPLYISWITQKFTTWKIQTVLKKEGEQGQQEKEKR